MSYKVAVARRPRKNGIKTALWGIEIDITPSVRVSDLMRGPDATDPKRYHHAVRVKLRLTSKSVD